MKGVGVLVGLLVLVPLTAANHEGPIGVQAIELIFGGSPEHATFKVLLMPPDHGDLGNPFGPTALDYLQVTLDGIHKWEEVLHKFAADFPQFSYLNQITISIEIFDGILVQPVGLYDVVLSYAVPGLSVYRGLAADCLDPPRCVLLSLFSNSPRAHQQLPDFPELNDLQSVTMHEIAHAFGLGHSTTWTVAHGPDLMNSPAAFVYGDGNPVGDGGERTKLFCASSLDLYGLAHLYRWLPNGNYQGSGGFLSLPGNIPYTVYC